MTTDGSGFFQVDVGDIRARIRPCSSGSPIVERETQMTVERGADSRCR